ncbi:MAG: alkaline phosphatase family protein [Acidimicrobiales bacterium]
MGDSIAIWAMVRNEERSIEPWVRYHQALGVEKFFLFLDRSTDQTLELAQRFDGVEIVNVEWSPEREPMSDLQSRLASRALGAAREAGIDWLLGVDVDEFAWGGSIDDLRAVNPPEEGFLGAGRLSRLVAERPGIEQIRLETLEVVPVEVPVGQSLFRANWVQFREPFVRSVAQPETGEPMLMDKFLGHQLGKTMIRVSASLVPGGPHVWVRPDGSEPASQDLGCHLHFFVGDFESWTRKCRGWSQWHDDTWEGSIPRPFPLNEWRDFVATSTEEQLRVYFDTQVVVDEATLNTHSGRQLFRTSVVSAVLDEAKPNGGRKLAFVGLDCFDHELAATMISENALPTLAAVIDRSACVHTIGPPGTFVANVWPDLYSGVGAAKHGVVCWKMFTPGSYDLEWRQIRVAQTHPVIWDALAAAGYRSAVIDAPLVPGWAANGIQVWEWGSHDGELGFAASPGALEDEIRSRVGDHRLDGHCNKFDRTPAEIAEFRDDMIYSLDRRTVLTSTMYDRDDWDLFLTVFAESHCIGHQGWHYHDSTSPKWGGDDADVVGDVVQATYRSIDRSLGEVLDRIDQDTTVMVWMSHGMGHHTFPAYLNDDILFALDQRRMARDQSRAETLARMSGQEQPDGRQPPVKEDLASRLFFDQLNNDPEGGIRLNVVGREPQGLVHPGEEYEQMCGWLAEQYLLLTDDETGEPLVADVLIASDHYEGPHLNDLPDLFVQWRRTDRYVSRVNVPGVESVVIGHPTSCRTGDHHPHGRLYVYGPGIEPGVINADKPILSRDITDLLRRFFAIEMDIDGEVSDEMAERVLGGSFAEPVGHVASDR